LKEDNDFITELNNLEIKAANTIKKLSRQRITEEFEKQYHIVREEELSPEN
jgi:hypothetical protein